MTREQIEDLLRVEQARIDAAYWIYTRTRRGKPPVLVVPDAYARRNELREMLRQRGGE